MENEISVKDILASFLEHKFFAVIVTFLSIIILYILYTFVAGYLGSSVYTSSFQFVEFAPYNINYFSNGESASIPVSKLEQIYADTEDKVITEEHFNEFLLNDLFHVELEQYYNLTSSVNVYTYEVELSINEITKSYDYSEKELTIKSDNFSTDLATFLYTERISRSISDIFNETYANTQSNIERLTLIESTIDVLEVKYAFYRNNYDSYKDYVDALRSEDYVNKIDYSKFTSSGELIKQTEFKMAELALLKYELYDELHDQRSSYDFGATSTTDFANKIEEKIKYLQQSIASEGNKGVRTYMENCLLYLNNMKIDLVVNVEAGNSYNPYVENNYDNLKTSISDSAETYQGVHNTASGLNNTDISPIIGHFDEIVPAKLVYIAIIVTSLMITASLLLIRLRKPTVVILHKR